MMMAAITVPSLNNNNSTSSALGLSSSTPTGSRNTSPKISPRSKSNSLTQSLVRKAPSLERIGNLFSRNRSNSIGKTDSSNTSGSISNPNSPRGKVVAGSIAGGTTSLGNTPQNSPRGAETHQQHAHASLDAGANPSSNPFPAQVHSTTSASKPSLNQLTLQDWKVFNLSVIHSILFVIIINHHTFLRW